MIVRITSSSFLKTMKAIILQSNISINELEETFFNKGWVNDEESRVGRKVIFCIDNSSKTVETNHYIEKNTDYFLESLNWEK